MKKLPYIFILLLAAAGCHNFEEKQEVRTVELADPQTEQMQEISVKAIISPDSTKTSLAANGYTVNWSAGDKISLLYSLGSSKYLADLTISSGAGTPEGIFTGALASGSTPVIAFYPAVEILSQSSFTTFYLNLATSLEQSGTSFDLAPGDIKASSDFSGSINGGLTVNFYEMGTLLDFLITPTEDMVSKGDKLRRLVFTASSSNVSGDYTINYNNGSPALTPSGSSNSKTRTLDFTGSVPSFTSGVATEALMMILPGIQKNEGVHMTLVTDYYYIDIDASASKEYLGGYKYRMDLDLPALSASSKATITPCDNFTQITDRLGIFDTDNPSSIVSTIADDVAGWQAGASSGRFRLQNWSSGEVITFTLPSSMTPGEFCDITVNSLKGTIPSGKLSLRYICSNGTRYWFRSADGNIGYIIEVL